MGNFLIFPIEKIRNWDNVITLKLVENDDSGGKVAAFSFA